MAEEKLAALITSAGARAGTGADLPVYSVTKHAGFVPSLEYFKKQVFSRDLKGYKLVEPGDFAYATIHLDEGSVGIAPERALISPMYTVFRIDHNRVDAGYLIRFLKSPRALAHYPLLGRGAVHRRMAISLEALGSLTIPLPPLDEQRKIAAILDQADAIRAKRRQVLAHLDSLTQSIFHDMFGDRDFPMVEAKTLMPSMRNGVSPSSGGEYRADVLTLTAVTQGAFNPDAKKTAMFAREPSDDKRVTASDFLMCRGNGNRALVGVGVIPRMSRPDLVFPDTVIAGSVDTSVVNPDFLEVVWTRPATRDQIESKARTTSGIHKINQQTLSEVLVPLPPMALQQKFATLLTGVRTRRHLVEGASNVDDELFASLQLRAFRGEL